MSEYLSMVKKVHTQFERGLITADEYASELSTLAINEGKRACEPINPQYIVTAFVGNDRLVEKFATMSEVNIYLSEWKNCQYEVLEFPGDNDACFYSGYDKLLGVPSGIMVEVRCIDNTQSCVCRGCANRRERNLVTENKFNSDDEDCGFTETEDIPSGISGREIEFHTPTTLDTLMHKAAEWNVDPEEIEVKVSMYSFSDKPYVSMVWER